MCVKLNPYVYCYFNHNLVNNCCACIFVKKNKKQKRLSPLAGLSFVFVIAGIVFGDDRLIGYSLIGVGIVLAVVGIIMKSKKK